MKLTRQAGGRPLEEVSFLTLLLTQGPAGTLQATAQVIVMVPFQWD